MGLEGLAFVGMGLSLATWRGVPYDVSILDLTFTVVHNQG